MTFKLDESGYVTKYLYSGKKESEFHDDSSDTNQLRYEKYLRSVTPKHEEMTPPKGIKLGENSALGMPWQYYYSHGNIFLDDSAFYIELRRIDLYAVTELVVEEDMVVTASLWSYSAVDLWVNDTLSATIDTPVYKPINRVAFQMSLKKGKNQVFVRLETLGVRDTRISFALQVLERQDEISVSLPDAEGVAPYVKAESLLNQAVLKGNQLIFTEPLPSGSTIHYDTESWDFRKLSERYVTLDISGQSEITLKDYAAFGVSMKIGDSSIMRHFERIELRKAIYLSSGQASVREVIYEKIAEVASITRGANDGFALYPMLARHYLGKRTKEDEMELMVTLKQIERRMDCADFMVCALIRLIKSYTVSEQVQEEIKRVMLGFRYWMDEEGQDGMCFWSENHSLMFYEAAYFFGQDYKEDIFLRSQKTGQSLYENARLRILEWLEDVCEEGYDEFNSGVYGPITFAAVLNLVDYAEPEISKMARMAADILLEMAARHCFKDVIISPQGRIYRDALYPQHQALQAIVSLVKPNAPYVYSEWLISLATSQYKIPNEFLTWMSQTGALTYNSSNAVIDFYKTEDYMLTSVQSPRRDGKTRIWEPNQEESCREQFIYTKSLNERFHGTMQFEPGVDGYQQHLWYAALDSELVVFTTHPGGSCEDRPARPGYWHGNGITPALKQNNNVLGIVYVIPENYPIKFTHLFWNEKQFTQTIQKSNWLFGRKESSYVAIWCSGEMVAHNDVLFECEKRTYGEQVAYLCVCSSAQESGDFETFVQKMQEHTVQYDAESLTLTSEFLQLTYKPHFNASQIVE